MRRRDVATAAIGALLGMRAVARAQSRQSPLRVGMASFAARGVAHIAAFGTRMAEFGYVDGKDFIFDHVQVPNLDGYAAAFRELVSRRADIIVTFGNDIAMRAARAAAGDRPIV